MVAVRILTSISGLEFSWHPGEQIDLPAAEAAKWCDNVRACYVDRPGGPAETTAQPVPGGETTDRPAPPPRSGPGSGDKAWREYAAASGVVVPAEAKREQVWQALEAAGVPAEADPGNTPAVATDDTLEATRPGGPAETTAQRGVRSVDEQE